MAIIDDLLSMLNGDALLQDACMGPFWTIVSTEKGAGMASTMRDAKTPHGHGLVRWAGELTEHTGREVAELVRSNSPIEASLGMAALNALIDVGHCEMSNRNAVDEIARRCEGKRAAVVGHFPFVPRIRTEAAHVDVLELNPVDGELPPECADEILPEAHVVVITGTSLVNKTFDGLLALCSPHAFLCVIGPTTPLSEVLFDYGVDLIAGTRVVDAGQAMAMARQGAILRQMRGVRLMTMERDGYNRGSRRVPRTIPKEKGRRAP